MHKHHYGILLMLTQIYYVFDKSYSQLVMVKKLYIVCFMNKNVAKKSETLSHKTDLCEHFALMNKFIFNFRTTLRLKQITKKKTHRETPREI